MIYQLHKIFNKLPRFRFPFEEVLIPRNGIYIIFEEGEIFENLDRIVRVGTHTGNNQLRARLKQHFIKENKNRSIFRKNIGRCLLSKENSSYQKLWELDVTSKADRIKNLPLLDIEFEKRLEKQISHYIQNNLSFTAFRVDTKEERLFWESKIVSSLVKDSIMRASTNWLGSFSPKEKIKKSCLWQVNELYKSCLTNEEYLMLEKLVD